MSPAEAERLLDELLHALVLAIESEPYPYIKNPTVQEGQKK